jgi:hypothetical protein
LTVGRTFTLEGWAFFTMNSTASTGTFSFYIGSAGDSVSFTDPVSVTNQPCEYKVQGVCRSTGTSGTVDMQGYIIVNGTKYYATSASVYTVNTTVANAINSLFTFSVASSNLSFTNHEMKLTIQ